MGGGGRVVVVSGNSVRDRKVKVEEGVCMLVIIV